MQNHYFDHVATNPLHPDVLGAMLPYFNEEFGNPLSNYPLGTNARGAIEEARETVAALIGVAPPTITFTSSGAEANNLAVRGIALALQEKGRHIIVSKVEHHSVLNAARYLEKSAGFTVTYLPVDGFGLVDPEALGKAMMDETTLVSIIHGSPEIGTIQPIRELAAVARERGALFHTDAVATAGNVPVDVEELGVDLLSMAAHQFYGPKGAAALYLRRGTRIVPLIYGGIQESGRRAGTENVPAIVGMGRAAALAKEGLQNRMRHVRGLRDRLIEGAMKVDNVILTGHPDRRLPGHASFCVEYIEGEAMLLMLAARGISVASGSACTSRALKSSPILLALGIPSGVAQGSVVFSMGDGNTGDEIDYALDEFPRIIARLREMSPYAEGWGDEEEKEKEKGRKK
jgi:cysteine desulfurase